MRHLKYLVVLLASILLLAPFCVLAVDDSVTLNSGEIVSGRITSETDTDMTVEVSNERHTVFTTRILLKSDVKEVHKLTPEQRQEGAAYEALGRYQLNPNDEFKSAYYTEGIAAFDKFLAAYPNSEHASQIVTNQTQWQFEKFEVDHGRVKFADKWMLPDAKKPLIEQQQREGLERVLQNQVSIVRAAHKRVDAAQNEHNFLHSTAGYKGKTLPPDEYTQVMARYAANDAEIPKANANLAAAVKKFDELYAQYQKFGGTVDYREQINAK